MAKVFIGSDHAGYSLKAYLIPLISQAGYEVVDLGPESEQSCDYPVFANKVCEAVLAEKGLGLLICGTGVGMSMAANKVAGIRAALCTNEYMARMTRAHNDANVLCMGERVTGPGVAEAIALAFLGTEFEGGRHQRRIDLFS
ncbi:MAG: ribose 5-phosphate isomerase B [Desulfovibrio sp.]|nr:MAG: ribose 5-phosphate isomerase B [Desulfovibrio sp.]